MRVISASLSPNVQQDDVLTAVRELCAPWSWKRGTAAKKVEAWFGREFHTDTAVSFNSGRSALLAILKSFDIGRGDEVIVQAFTCVAVPNSVLWAGARPVFADIDDTYNLDPADLQRKITKKTKAVVVQHTFGIPAQMDTIAAIAKKYNLILIEDCAHSLGAKNAGHRGDAAFFSFGRDKVISSVWGGMAIIKSNHQSSISKLKKYHETLPMPGYFWIFQQLLHPIAFAIILPTYNLLVGKILLVLLQKARLLSFPVYPEEKLGRRPGDFPARYPNALAVLLLAQLEKLSQYNVRRRTIAKRYGPVYPGAVYLRYPLRVKNPNATRERAKQQGVLLGNWYHAIVDPQGVNLKAIGYVRGSCPAAEDAADHVINLPTLVTEREAETILHVVRTTL